VQLSDRISAMAIQGADQKELSFFMMNFVR